ncbi:MAG: hypothetical protein CVU64_01835 [Deltaproteobacteria bacterium HGW-Deltaproteobacteria-21]|nr:MAG: hypothetical protein CVU64_01835 [Deltaproteobacteria bacterium HGW-Deltaproteobacteria-21]
MVVLSFIYRYGIWVSVPAFVISIVLLVRCIARAVRTMRQARIFSAPLRDQQEVEFTDAGKVVLAMEGPFLSTRFAGLEYELLGPDGMTVESRPSLFRARSSGLRKARMELRVYSVRTPGRHVFQIRNLEGEKGSDDKHRMIFTRPHLGRILVCVIGIVFSAMLMIGSIVLFFLRLTSNGDVP